LYSVYSNEEFSKTPQLKVKVGKEKDYYINEMNGKMKERFDESIAIIDKSLILSTEQVF